MAGQNYERPITSLKILGVRSSTKARICQTTLTTVPEIIDPVFAKTSQNARFLLSENERFGLVFVKNGSINSGTVCNIGYLGPVRLVLNFIGLRPRRSPFPRLRIVRGASLIANNG
jgi:hypothetical protein